MIRITGATRRPEPKQDPSVITARLQAKKVAKVEIPWRQRVHQTLRAASEIAGVSVAALYRYESEGRLKFRRLAGRTLVTTESLVPLVENAEPWTPSNRGSEARARRSELARASWQEHAA